jgi:hypothetical protein
MQAIRHNRGLPLRVVPPKRCRRFHDYLGTGKPCWPPEVDFSFHSRRLHLRSDDEHGLRVGRCRAAGRSIGLKGPPPEPCSP